MVTFRFGTFTMLFHTTRHVVGHEVLKNAWYVVIKGLEKIQLTPEIIQSFLHRANSKMISYPAVEIQLKKYAA